MNNNINFPYMPLNILNQNIYEELKRLNYNLEKIQNMLEKNTSQKENNYLKKDDSYYML